MAKTIKYRTQCIYCNEFFDKGQAFLQRSLGRWLCQCFDCYKKRKQEKVKNKKILDDLANKYNLKGAKNDQRKN